MRTVVLVALEILGKSECVRIAILSLRSIKLIAPFSRLCMCSFLLPRLTGITAHTRAHTDALSVAATNGELDEELLVAVPWLLTVERSRDGVIRHDKTADSGRQKTK